eukprot:4649545-Ditylum_brightwellii.AAC.1
MKYQSEAIDTISASQSSLLLSIINVWTHAMPMEKSNLLSQQHLVGLRCINATSKKLLIIYLPQVKVTIGDDDDTNKECITSMTSDSAGRLHPVKALASQLFYNFDELARPYDNVPAHFVGDVIEDIPETDSANPPLVTTTFASSASHWSSELMPAQADGGLLPHHGPVRQHHAVPVLFMVWHV